MQALLLGKANVVDSLLRVLVPIALVRLFDVQEYGLYVLFWLIATTITLIAPFGMVRSLLYFIPRSTRSEKEAFVSQTIYWIVFAALLSAFAVSQLNPLLPDNIRNLSSYGILIPSFMFLWVSSSLIEFLPSADQNISWQAGAILGLTLIRNTTIVAAAYFGQDLEVVFFSLLVFAVLKLTISLYYIISRYGMGCLLPRFSMFKRQLTYAGPFGLSGIFFNLRSRVGQWVVALMFPPGSFAVFSIAISINMIANVLRSSMASVIVPTMSQSEGGGDHDRVLQLNNRANIAISSIIFPFASFIFFFAGLVVEVLYTDKYLDAVPVVRIYLIGTIILAVEMGSVLVVLRQGNFVLRVSAALLAVTLISAYYGALLLGISGVAVVAVAGTFIGRVLNFRRVSKLTNKPLRSLQDWLTLTKLFFASIVASIIALTVCNILAGSWSLFLQLFISGVVFLPVYLGVLTLIGGGWIIDTLLRGREWAG